MNALIDTTTGQVVEQYFRPAIKTTLNAKYFPKQQEVNTLPSRTIPDQTLPLRTILDRYARGLPIDGVQHPVYHGEEFMPDLRKLDLSEIHDLKQYVREQIAEQQADLQKQSEEAKKPKKQKDEPSDKQPLP